MPYQQCFGSEGYFYGSVIASALTNTLEEDGTYGNGFYDQSEFYYQEIDEWRRKSVKMWSGRDIVHWITSVAREMNVCPTDTMAEKFASMDGLELSGLSRQDFVLRDRNYGIHLYQKLQELLEAEGHSLMPLVSRQYLKVEEPIKVEESTLMRLEVNNNLDSEPQLKASSPAVPCKKGRGRPRLPRRKKKTEKLGRLWEFLRDLLKNPKYCPSLIVWENHDEGMFRFVHSDKVAKLWGSKKDNPDMNYEKLSRAMRYYYRSQVLLPVYGRRLVYKFGPTAKGWRVENPNFVK